MKTTKIFLLISFIWVIGIYQSKAQLQFQDSLKIRANAQLTHHDYKSVIAVMNAELNQNQSDADLFIFRGKAFLYCGQAGNAISDFSAAEKLKENSASYELAQAYAAVGNAQYACNTLKKYLKTPHKKFQSEIKNDKYFEKISDSKAWNNLWKEDFYSKIEQQLDEAQFEISRDRDADAFAILDKIISKNKSAAEALFMRAKLNAKNKDYKNALRDLDQTLKLKPENTDYLSTRAEILFENQKYQKALDDYNSLNQKIKCDISFLKQKALTENELKDFDNAKNDISAYLNFYSWDTEALYIAGKINFNEKNYFEALKSFNRCIEKDNSKTTYFEARGDVYFAIKTYEFAEKDYSMALDLVSSNGEVFYKKGLCRLALNNIEGACSDWKKSLELGYFPAGDYLKKYEKKD
jgi:tetratricopeptide (TPR) repeat protein